MQTQSELSAAAVCTERMRGSRALRRVLRIRSSFEMHDVHSIRRLNLENYIAACFSRAYQASVTEFAPLLLEMRCAETTGGVAGIRPATAGPLFLEQYLDVPVERVASDAAGEAVGRDEIIELCNLAALQSGACQLINVMLAAVLYGAGFRYAGFAGTAQLEGIVRKQNFSVQSVGVADPVRLGLAAEQWGRYYDTCPNVLLVDLEQTLSALCSQPLSAAVFRIYSETISRLVDDLGAFAGSELGSAASIQ